MAKFKLKKRKIWGYTWFSNQIDPFLEMGARINNLFPPQWIPGGIFPYLTHVRFDTTKERSIMAPEQELVLREFAEGIQRAITEGLEQALCPPALTWQVDQPKPMRNMTVEEIWWSKGHCKFRISSNCLIDMHNSRNGCHNCILIDRNSKTPSDSHWQAPQVPLNFTVEG